VRFFLFGHCFLTKWVFGPYYPTHIKSSKTLCNQAEVLVKEQSPLDLHTRTMNIFHTVSLSAEISCCHMTLSYVLQKLEVLMVSRFLCEEGQLSDLV
jgi:hypothetical protein